MRPPIESIGLIANEPELVIDAGTASVVGELVQRLAGLRLESLVPVLLERLRNDPAASVRTNAATALLGHLAMPGMRSTLATAAVSDPVESVRQTASLVLAPPPAGAAEIT